MTEENTQDNKPKSQFEKFTDKVKKHKKSLITVALAGAGLAAAVKLLPSAVGNKYEKVGIRRMDEEDLGLGIQGDNLFFYQANNGVILYKVEDIEATDGGGNFDWRTIEALDYCGGHGEECLVAHTNDGKERHFTYFLCSKVKAREDGGNQLQGWMNTDAVAAKFSL